MSFAQTNAAVYSFVSRPSNHRNGGTGPLIAERKCPRLRTGRPCRRSREEAVCWRGERELKEDAALLLGTDPDGGRVRPVLPIDIPALLDGRELVRPEEQFAPLRAGKINLIWRQPSEESRGFASI